MQGAIQVDTAQENSLLQNTYETITGLRPYCGSPQQGGEENRRETGE
jgi:hypothetical protein